MLTLGAVLPLTGELEAAGAAMQAAVEMAVDEVNDQGGVLGADVVLVVEDSGSTAEGAAAASTRLIDGAAVDAMIGPASTRELTGAMLSEALAAERVVCSPTASGPQLLAADARGVVFTLTPSSAGEADVIARALKADGDDRVAIVRSGDAGQEAMAGALLASLSGAFGAGGFDVVAEVSLGASDAGDAGGATPDEPADPSAPTADAAVDALVRARPEAVIVLASPDEAAPVFRAMFDAGLLPSAGEDGAAVWVTDSLASEALAPAVDPRRPAILEAVAGVRPAPRPASTAFDARLRARQAVTETAFGAETYDCSMLVMLAALAGGTDDPARLRSIIPGLTEGGAPCATFAACSGPLLDGADVRYTGVLGVALNAAGEPASGSFERFSFDAAGRIVPGAVSTVTFDGTAPTTTTTTGGRPGSPTSAPLATPSTLAETNGGDS